MSARQDWRAPLVALHVQLLRAREAQGRSQVDVADAICVPRRTFQRFEDGTADPRSQDLFRWAAEVGVAITSAVAGEGGR